MMLSPEQYVYNQVATYPALYHADGYESAAINIKNQGQLDCYEQLLDQFWSDGTADRELQIPMRLEKYASKTERSKTPVLVGIGTDEDTRSCAAFSRVLVHLRELHNETTA